MPKASRAMPEVGQRVQTQEDLGFRSLEVRASSFNEDARTIEATISTESPVPMWDWNRGEYVPEILIASGAQFPKTRQVPFLDSHNRNTVKDQLGSARGINVADGTVTATLHFSRTAYAEDAMSGVRDGHVTDVSVGYEIMKRVYVAPGESKTVAGRSVEGPANVVTKWRLREVSLTPIGADAQAKLRGLDPAAFRFESARKGQFEMNPELRKLLVSRGMAADLNDDEAQEWMLKNIDALPAKREEKPEQPEQRSEKPAQFDEAKLAEMIARETAKAIAKRDADRAAFRKEVEDLCDIAGLPTEADHCRSLADVAAVRSHLQAKKREITETIGYSPSVRITGTGFDRLRQDMGTALNLRAMQAAGGSEATHAKVFPVDKRGKGADTFRYATPYQMAEEFVRGAGIDIRGLTREQVAICAMFGPEKAGLDVRSAAYHVTGSFSNLTLDAMNKSMSVGYTETPTTWRGPMRQAASVPDFKEIHRIRMGAVPNLPVWNDNKNPEQASFSDAREHYAVESRSLEISYSYKLLVNDDMDALSRTPAMMGAAAARTVNAVAWAQITSNPTMSDGVALFATATGNRKRTNLTSGAGAPSVTTLQTLSNLMRQMRGENTPEGAESQDILNLMPRYLVGPSALDTTIKQLILSAYDPAATNHLTYNTATTLIPVVEPLLDAASTTAWFLFADPSQIDTVEVSFLQGQESPVTRQFMDEKNLSQSVTILQTFAAKAMNHRGVQKHAGA